MLKVILYIFFTRQIICARSDKNLSEWIERMKNPNFLCHDLHPENPNYEVFFKIVSCDQPGAIFNYNFKLKSGKKFKKGLFNGHGTIYIDKSHNYGFKSKKCIFVHPHHVTKFTGNFSNDDLEGDVIAHFQDETFVKGQMKNGKWTGPKRFFEEEGQLLNITMNGNIIWKEDPKSGITIFNCYSTKLGPRCLFVKDLEKFKSCIFVDEDFYANCFVLDNLDHISFDGCAIKMEEELKVGEKLTNFRVSTNQEELQNHQEKFRCSPNLTLRSWLNFSSDHSLLFNYFNDLEDPIEENNLEIEFDINHLKGRKGFSDADVCIENWQGTVQLFQGKMINGVLKGKIDPEIANHPAWRSKLIIGLGAKRPIFPNDDPFDRFDHYMIGSFKNGKLHGLVQIFGILPMDPKGFGASVLIRNGLSFIGFYENGKPKGPCWRALVGGSYFFGVVDDQGEFTGSKDLAFVHQDLELALIGDFSKGLMVSGQESEIIDYYCNDDGIMVPKFSPPKGPIFHYEPPTNISFGDQPHLQDALDKKYTFMKVSSKQEGIGDGVFAARTIPPNTVATVFSGFLYIDEQKDIKSENLQKMFQENKCTRDDPFCEAQWKYNINTIGNYKSEVDIPLEYGMLNEYQGSLGHKVNHDFTSTTEFVMYETARFGLVLGVKTKNEPIEKGQELLVDYKYDLSTAPKWYRELYKEFARKYPEARDDHEENLEKIKLEDFIASMSYEEFQDYKLKQMKNSEEK